MVGVCVWLGACVAEGCAWQHVWQGGMHGRVAMCGGGACKTGGVW